jgi:hypothetical protein
VRVIIEGETPAHPVIMSDPWRWTNEVRAQADEHTWIERVDWRTRSQPGPLPSDGPIGALTSFMASLREEPPQLTALCHNLKELQDLSKKLFQQTGKSLPLDDEAALLGALDQVEPFLIRRLLSRSG